MRRLVLLALLATPAFADAPAIKDPFGFDWIHPAKSRCTKVKGALLKKLETKYTCREADAGSASGKPVVAVCTAKGKRRSEFMLLGSLADCKLERETQLANGP